MAHFAEIDDDNVVLRVIVVADKDTSTDDGIEDAAIGAEFCHDLLGGNWIQTSWSGSFHGQFAGIGFEWLPDSKVFTTAQPYPSWTLDGHEWVPPVPRPEDADYDWDEDAQAWVEQ